MTDSPRTYSVSRADREPLVRAMVDALRAAGCRILHEPRPDQAPFRITFERPSGERMGIVAYAFLANRPEKPTRNRPVDERFFQLKYGGKVYGTEPELHELWQDPYGLYTTLLLGIDPKEGFFVALDPVLRSPTKFHIRIEFKDRHAARILRDGWATWERDRRDQRSGGKRRDDVSEQATWAPVDLGTAQQVEVVVGARMEHFLRYVLFEREAFGLAPGPRQLVAEKILGGASAGSSLLASGYSEPLVVPAPTVHRLCAELQLGEREILDMILNAPRLKMAVRGWTAEHHLVDCLRPVDGVTEAAAIKAEGGPDVRVVFEGRPLTIECKNVLRQTTSAGIPRLDLQRTRASTKDKCSRYYQPSEFDVVAACLHAVTEQWEFRFALPGQLDSHPRCPGRLSNNVRVAGDRWIAEARRALLEAVRAA